MQKTKTELWVVDTTIKEYYGEQLEAQVVDNKINFEPSNDDLTEFAASLLQMPVTQEQGGFPPMRR